MSTNAKTAILIWAATLCLLAVTISAGHSVKQGYDYVISFGMHDCDRKGYCAPGGR
jgi:hypothetical protein